MKKTTIILLFLIALTTQAQNATVTLDSIQATQNELNEKFSNPETTILEPEMFKNFKGLDFYPIDLKYAVTATFVRTPNEKPFLMPTTTDRLPEYLKYGELHFELEGLDLVLEVFQNTSPKEGYEDYLFLPFTDWTSGDGSYGGGRYLDLYIPQTDTMVLDFNASYNPYCAYNENYSCPIPPKQNDLPIRIEAGVKEFKKN